MTHPITWEEYAALRWALPVALFAILIVVAIIKIAGDCVRAFWWNVTGGRQDKEEMPPGKTLGL